MPANEAQLIAYANKARTQGIDKLLFYLTFDCDTDEDAQAALELDPWLRVRGINAAYAVPGAQLRRSADKYQKIQKAGAKFLNHGGQPHAQWQGDRYVPITFYEQWTTDEVIEDIELGHLIVREIIGTAPRGFRAPHFGSYQRSDQLAVIYNTARKLGYRYCSTTVPQVGLEHGPVIDRHGLFEIPLFGFYREPTLLLDSWTCLDDRKDYRLGQRYFERFLETVNYMQKAYLPGVIAYYADPAHVIAQKPFLDAMELVVERGIPSVTAEDLLAIAAGRSTSGTSPT